MSEDTLIYTVEDGIATFTINRERRRNSLDRKALIAFISELAQIETGQIRGVIITGAGEASFCAGADIKELAELETLDQVALTQLGQDLVNTIELLPVPTVAAIEGFCLGGGLEIAMACDLRIAGSSSTFGLPEVLVDALASWGGTVRLPKIVGQARAREMVLFGKKISASKAVDWGLISTEVEDGSALGSATSTLTELASKTNGETLMLAKKLLASCGEASSASGHSMSLITDLALLSRGGLGKP